jgi:ferrochelatase
VSTAVLLSCHGTVESLDDVPGFLANIRRGRPAPPDLVHEVRSRLQQIGGSPLLRITREQAAALSEKIGMRCAIAGRLWAPYPREVLEELAREGVREVISLPIAPHSVHVYHASVREAASHVTSIERVRYCAPWGLESKLIRAFEACIDEALARFEEAARSKVALVLTAHSLPEKIIAAGDPYERDFRAMAGAVADRVRSRVGRVEIAFQSQGATNDVWLGPDLATTFARLVAEGSPEILVAPIGFLTEHVETLYDLDIDAVQLAKKAGVTRYERAGAPNARAELVEALAAVVASTP